MPEAWPLATTRIASLVEVPGELMANGDFFGFGASSWACWVGCAGAGVAAGAGGSGGACTCCAACCCGAGADGLGVPGLRVAFSRSRKVALSGEMSLVLASRSLSEILFVFGG